MSPIATITVGLLACCSGLLAGASCNRNIHQQCYEEVEYVAPEPGTLPPDFPYCTQTLGFGPEPPDGYGFTHHVDMGFVPSEDEPCDPCDVDRLDGLLRAAIQDRLSQGSESCARIAPSDPVGMCVYQPDATSDQCRVLGVFYSNQRDVPVEHGCTDCRENDSCDHDS